MGAVALAVTGAEALYADLANFGKSPILTAWYGIAFPALLLNYLGQAAYLDINPAASTNTGLFFLLCPMNLRVPLVLLATAATVIASQALISAVFTLVRQGKSLDILPPFISRHTNPHVREQIYIPAINFILGLFCILLIVVFRTGTSLANAYGVAVTGAMVVTSILWGLVMFSRTDVAKWQTMLILCGLLILDLTLFASWIFPILPRDRDHGTDVLLVSRQETHPRGDAVGLHLPRGVGQATSCGIRAAGGRDKGLPDSRAHARAFGGFDSGVSAPHQIHC